jgi:hypothetical protein
MRKKITQKTKNKIKGVKMKKLISGIVVFGFVAFFIGCQENSNVVAPSVPQLVESGTIEGGYEFLSLADILGVDNDDLQSDGLSMEAQPTVERDIYPATGGLLQFKKSFTVNKKPVSIDWSLKFYPGAVNQKMRVKMVIFYDTLSNSVSTSFYPSPTTFNVPADLNIRVTGVSNIAAMGSEPILFAYFNEVTGEWETQGDVESVGYDPINNTFTCINAKVPHFSRYGWVRKSN